MQEKGRRSDILKKIVDLLSELDLELDDDCHIMADSGYDESILIGTHSSILYFAKVLIETVLFSSDPNEMQKHLMKKENLGGIQYITTHLIKELFNDVADVWPVCLFLADNEKDARELVDRIKNG
jgi:hypothetical protein